MGPLAQLRPNCSLSRNSTTRNMFKTTRCDLHMHGTVEPQDLNNANLGYTGQFV
jgi:hypothetical protein